MHVTLDDNVNEMVELKGVAMTQLSINMNDATTGHKLQDMPKDKSTLVSCCFIPNWIYVVLSRASTLKGLFLLKPLQANCLEKFRVPRDLQAFERGMHNLESKVIATCRRNMTSLEQRDNIE